jgi:hypothetical protein
LLLIHARNLFIQRAARGFRPVIEHMGIDHCGFDILVTENFLNGADIIACFKQVSGKAMAEGMRINIL